MPSTIASHDSCEHQSSLDMMLGASHGEGMTVTASPRTPATRQGSAHHGTGFWLIAAVFAISMAFSTVPTPLYPIYQQQDGFTPFTVTVVFAVYAVGVVTSLLLAGHVSDWIGRKRVLLPAL